MKIPVIGLVSDLDVVGSGSARCSGCASRAPRHLRSTLAATWAASLTLGVALWLAPAAPAIAALGGSADSVTADSAVMRAVPRRTSLVQYDVQEIQSGNLTVREYVTRQGQVFAVTWQGPEMPNLQQLLGEYFGSFQAAAVAAQQGNPGIHRQLSITRSDLVLLSSGRMRDFHGYAYLPALVPEGVSVSALQ
jgi:Protein of unknown function (DUF2844)